MSLKPEMFRFLEGANRNLIMSAFKIARNSPQRLNVSQSNTLYSLLPPPSLLRSLSLFRSLQYASVTLRITNENSGLN